MKSLRFLTAACLIVSAIQVIPAATAEETLQNDRRKQTEDLAEPPVETTLIGNREELSFYEGSGESSLVITAGSVGYVNLRDQATVEIEEGDISHASLHDVSLLTAKGESEISHLTLADNTQASIEDSTEIAHFTLSENASVLMSGNPEISHLTLTQRATGEIAGGKFSFLRLFDNSEVNIRQLSPDPVSISETGASSGTITLAPGTTLNIYAQNISFSEGQLEGVWANGLPFSFSLLVGGISTEEETDAFEIPEALPEEIIFHQIDS